ncbi:MAG: EscF/YscF/HrpA family type III secretion system needle major subunit [Deltaproteobacteria bacterium]|jgi:type III secretion protein F|nr:EscF/YscF/HrpA family type III secretion system needle major subunit [Deltaproteobacteria bacterium]
MSGGFGSVGNWMQTALPQLQERGNAFETRMKEMTSDPTKGVAQEDLLYMQYEMGQYNALMELSSNIVKSMTETLKSLAQKTS